MTTETPNGEQNNNIKIDYNSESLVDKFKEKYDLPVRKTMELDTNLKLVVYTGKTGDNQYDIRYYNQKDGRHTIRGVRLRKGHMRKIFEVYQELASEELQELLRQVAEKKKEIGVSD